MENWSCPWWIYWERWHRKSCQNKDCYRRDFETCGEAEETSHWSLTDNQLLIYNCRYMHIKGCEMLRLLIYHIDNSMIHLFNVYYSALLPRSIFIVLSSSWTPRVPFLKPFCYPSYSNQSTAVRAIAFPSWINTVYSVLFRILIICHIKWAGVYRCVHIVRNYQHVHHSIPGNKCTNFTTDIFSEITCRCRHRRISKETRKRLFRNGSQYIVFLYLNYMKTIQFDDMKTLGVKKFPTSFHRHKSPTE